MPLYDYYCIKCSKVYEIIVKLDYEGKIKCPHCKNVLKKRISPPKTIKIN